MKRILTAVALLALALPAFPQQPPFQEEIEVNAVLLDVIVTDSKGNQILGLGPDDFVVEENGHRQAVDSADYFTNRRLLDSTEQQAPFKVERVRENRYFIFFFDKPENPGVLFDQLTLAREGVRDFVRNEMKDTDHVAIAGHDVRLKIYSDFTTDKAKLEKALNEVTKFGQGLRKFAGGDGPSILKTVDFDHTGTVYEALDELADSVRSIRARKNVVIFSPGIVAQDETVQSGLIVSRSRYFEPMLESLNAANVSIYTVQLQRNAPTDPFFHERLQEMAQSTGGEYFRFATSFRTPIGKIENTNSGYYLLTYRSKHPRGTTGYQKVDVSTKNPEFRVVARSGYQYGG